VSCTRRELIGGALAGLCLARARAVEIEAGQSPTPDAITALSGRELVRRVSAGELSPEEVVGAYLARIERLNPDLGAYITVTADQARGHARRLGTRRPAGSGPLALAGLPIAHKDLFDTAAVRTTGGSRLYADRVPVRNAALVARLAAAGAITLGKTNTHELGGGVTTINPFYGTTRNPRDHARVAGGSSGGSAAAVAARMAAAATGSDTGGSIRIPAAFCGCVGFKPSFGVLSTAGLLGACPTFDHAGFITRTVDDVAMLMDTVPPREPTGPVPPMRGLRIGVPRGYFFEQLEDAVMRAVEDALHRCRDAGASVRDVAVPVDATTMGRVFDPIVLTEIRDTYDQAWRERPDAFSKDFAAVFHAPRPSAPELATARQALREFQAAMARVFDDLDILVTPTVPTTAPRIDGPVDGMRILRNAWPFNAARMPALSIPCGPPAALPVGLQIVGRRFDDGRVLGAGARLAHLLGDG
jgi:aspartyl-tRNA(Asn)/glutamyl-tRNA(Gln) amidotransferase subunit A